MAFVHGKKSGFKLDNSAGSLQDLSTYFTDLAFPQTLDVAEVSTLGDNSKEYVVGLADRTISGSGKWDAALDSHMSLLINALLTGTLASATFEYGPEGTTSGKVKYTGECFVTSYEASGGIGDAVGFSFEAQVSGDVTRTTF
jgi:hypothetical protein